MCKTVAGIGQIASVYSIFIYLNQLSVIYWEFSQTINLFIEIPALLRGEKFNTRRQDFFCGNSNENKNQKVCLFRSKAICGTFRLISLDFQKG
jgi:hypothetical protein